MKYTFYKVKNKRFDHLECWWVLVINNPEVLVEYIGLKSEDIVLDYFKAKEKLSKNYHLDWQQACLLQVLSNKENRKTIIDDVKILSDEMLAPLIRYYLEGKILIVNKLGGYCFLDDEIKILEKLEKDEMIWPDDNRYGIRILKWPQGKHYYAKVGNRDVEDNKGNCKWNTAKQAEKWAKKFQKRILSER